jgi:uncharacterized protein
MLTSAIIGSQRRRPGNVFGSLVAFFIGLPSAWVLAAAAAGSVLVLTALLSAMPGPRPRGRWTQTPAWHDLGGGWPGGWGTGGMQDSSGSFSGGGGDFGGGGASGRW